MCGVRVCVCVGGCLACVCVCVCVCVCSRTQEALKKIRFRKPELTDILLSILHSTCPTECTDSIC